MVPKKAVAIAGAKLPAEKGHCVLCAVVAERACQRCGDFYCSKDCQLQDWQRHRYICFPMPALVYPKSFSVHLSASSEELSVVGACFLDKPDEVVVESGRPLPLQRISRDLNCDGAVSKVDSSAAGAASKSVPVTSAPIPHASNSIVSNNTIKASKKNVSPPKAIVPASNSLVFISGFRSPNRCYIRDASEMADKAFSQMCQKVNVIGNEMMPIIGKVRTHAYCLARYNGVFHRASVITTTAHHTARLLLFDLGIVKSRNLSDMREINEELLSLPSFSVQVQLKNVPNYAITEDVIEFLTRFEGEKFLAVYTKGPGAINVELMDPETKKSLNTQICEFCINKKVFESPFSANKNQTETEPTKAQTPNAGLTINKPTSSPETTPFSNTKNNTSSKIKKGIEAENVSSTSIQARECTHIEIEEKLNETNDIAKLDSNPQYDECAKEPGENTEGAEPTSEIKNLNLCQEPKANYSSLEKGTNPPLSKSKDETVRDFLTQCLVSRPTLPGSYSTYKEASSSVKLMEQLEVQAPHTQSKVQENRIVGALLVPPFQMRRFSIPGIEGIDVYVVDVSKIARGIFGAFDCSFASEFSTLHSRLAEITDSEPYKPALKEFVLARFEGSWYRGRVEQVKQAEYRVMYLDYSNAADVTEQDIRRYPLDFTTPCLTNICMIDGFPHKPNPAQVAYLSETVKVHQLLHVDGVVYLSNQSNIAIIKSRSLIEKLMSL